MRSFLRAAAAHRAPASSRAPLTPGLAPAAAPTPKPAPTLTLTLALALTLTLAPPLAAQRRADPLAGFDAYVAKAVKDWGVPGLAVAVVAHDSVVFAKGYGVRTLGLPDPVDANTLFAIGSTTKAFTAASLGILVDQGKIRWDDPVIDYLPNFQLWDPWVTRHVTIRDLMTHRTGLGGSDLLWYGSPYDYPEIMRRLRWQKPETSFRSAYAYQNIMVATAGQVVAAVSGMPWTEFVRTHFFQPLGMSRVSVSVRDLPATTDVASPHDVIDDTLRAIPWRPLDNIAPAGALNASVNDMAKWIRFLLDSTRLDGKRVLSPATLAELWTPQTTIRADDFYPTTQLTHAHFTAYGIAWFLEDYRGEKVVMHTGSIDGMVAIVGLLPDRKVGIVVLANRDHAEVRHALMFDVFDRYLGPPATSRDWSADVRRLYAGLAAEGAKAQAAQLAKRVTGTQPSFPLARYTGTYVDSLYGDITVRQERGHLVVTLDTAFVGDLSHWQYDEFRVTWRNHGQGTAFARFEPAGDGTVRAVALAGIAEFIHQPEESTQR